MVGSGGSRKLGTGAGGRNGGGGQNQILAVCTERSTGKSPPPYHYGSERGGGGARSPPPSPKSTPGRWQRDRPVEVSAKTHLGQRDVKDNARKGDRFTLAFPRCVLLAKTLYYQRHLNLP